MCEVGHIITLVWALSSICELRLITWAATYTKCLKVISSWLALIRLMDIIKQNLEGALGCFQGGWGWGRSLLPRYLPRMDHLGRGVLRCGSPYHLRPEH